MTEAWKRASWNAQVFLDHIPPGEIPATLTNLDRLKILQYINSVGTEPWRYFRLSPTERSQFDIVINKIRRTFETADVDETVEIEVAAREYGRGMMNLQRDSRYRTAAFLTAFVATRERMGINSRAPSQT